MKQNGGKFLVKSAADLCKTVYRGNVSLPVMKKPTMPSELLPPIHIPREVYDDLLKTLTEGESINSFILQAVKNELARRHITSQLQARSRAAIERSEAAGDWIPAEVVIERLEAKLDAARLRRNAED